MIFVVTNNSKENFVKITGLHFLLTYQCTFACDHCFVWGSPWQTGTMTLAEIRFYLQQAQDSGTVTSVYFEGGVSACSGRNGCVSCRTAGQKITIAARKRPHDRAINMPRLGEAQKSPS